MPTRRSDEASRYTPVIESNGDNGQVKAKPKTLRLLFFHSFSETTPSQNGQIKNCATLLP